MQDRNLYEDLSAPTASTSSVFTVVVAAAKEKRFTAVIDKCETFLHANMTGQIPVHMRLDSAMSRVLTELDPTYERGEDEKGCTVVRLDRA